MMPTKPKLRLIINSLLLLMAFFACTPENQEKDDYKDFSTWRSAVNDAPVKSTFEILGHTPQVVMCVQRKASQEYFTGLNVLNGKILWQTLVPGGDSIAVGGAHVHGNQYIFSADGKIRSINLQNGTYDWEISAYNLLVPDIAGFGEHFYFSAQSEAEPRLGAIYKGNAVTGQIEELALAPYTDSLATHTSAGILGRVSRIDAVNVNGVSKLIVQSTFRSSYNNTFWGRDKIGFFNVDTNEWEWVIEDFATKFVDSPRLAAARYVDGMILISGYLKLVCRNAVTAEEIWSMPAGISDVAVLNSDMIVIIDSNIIRNLNLTDGSQRWSIASYENTNSSGINIHNKYIYLANRFSAYALDQEIRNAEWAIRLQGPTHRKNNYFRGECAVIPLGTDDEAMVIFTTDMEVYAFKAL
jgi:outer membrane protein assembly factor BamB